MSSALGKVKGLDVFLGNLRIFLRYFFTAEDAAFGSEAPFGSEPQGRRQARREIAEKKLAFPHEGFISL
jgi:hypothetical protein